MTSGEQRTTIVATMWFAIALIGIAMAIAGSGTTAIFALVIIALLATVLLMREPGQGLFSYEKQKRSLPADQVAMLMDVLDDDERAEFKAMLKQRVLAQFGDSEEGELPAGADTLAALLDEHKQDRAASG